MDVILKGVRKWLSESTRTDFNNAVHEAKLTPRQEAIARLRYIECLTCYQIAMQLNVSEKTVNNELNMIYKAVDRLL